MRFKLKLVADTVVNWASLLWWHCFTLTRWQNLSKLLFVLRLSAFCDHRVSEKSRAVTAAFVLLWTLEWCSGSRCNARHQEAVGSTPPSPQISYGGGEGGVADHCCGDRLVHHYWGQRFHWSFETNSGHVQRVVAKIFQKWSFHLFGKYIESIFFSKNGDLSGLFMIMLNYNILIHNI